LFLSNINPYGQHALVRAGETVSRLLDHIFLNVRQNDVRASLCKRGRNAEPDARSVTRDDRGLTGDVVHFARSSSAFVDGYSLERVADRDG
jgi:hypothetical protein